MKVRNLLFNVAAIILSLCYLILGEVHKTENDRNDFEKRSQRSLRNEKYENTKHKKHHHLKEHQHKPHEKASPKKNAAKTFTTPYQTDTDTVNVQYWKDAVCTKKTVGPTLVLYIESRISIVFYNILSSSRCMAATGGA